MHAIKRTT